MCVGRGWVPISCPGVSVCWGAHTRVTNLPRQSCKDGQHMLSEGSSWGLSRQLFSLSFIDLMPIKEHRITMSEDKYTRHKHTHMCTQTQIKKDNSKCLFWVYERGGQTRSSRSLSGHRVPSQHERSPVLGGWTETERGFFVLCNYAIVFPL